MIERALITSGGKLITIRHLHFMSIPEKDDKADGSERQKSRTGNDAGDPSLNLSEVEKLIIQKALDQANGNIEKAARILGISRPKLYRKLQSGCSATTRQA